MGEFNFTYAVGVTAKQALGFEVAGQIWGKHLNNGAKINIHVGVDASLSNTKVLGGAIPGMVAKQTYDVFSANLQAGADSDQEKYMSGQLRSNRYNFTRSETGEGQQTADRIDITRANAKALKLVKENDEKLDGYIVLSPLGGTTGATWSYDFGRSGAIGSSQVDFLSTALHEIGHVIGFVSSVDRNRNGNTPEFLSPLDLFRGAVPASGQSTSSAHELTYGQNTAFFLDRQAGTILGNFAKGADTSRGGDGVQTSHWVEGQGLMDALLAKGEQAKITARDLKAFDILGWQIDASTMSNADIMVKAKDALATRMGWSTSQLESQLSANAGVVGSDQSAAIGTLLSDSEIYNWGRNPLPPPPPPTPQELAQIMANQGLFDTIGDPVEMLLESINRSATEFTTQTGTDGVDRLTGGRRDDLLVGNNGDDRLSGGKGHDVLWGGQGADQLWGDKGNDVLSGGAGNDRLWGGKGQDIFTLEVNAGFDVVEDFRDGQDSIKLSSGLEFGQLSIDQQGRNTVIQFEGQSLMLLSNIKADRITAVDFRA